MIRVSWAYRFANNSVAGFLDAGSNELAVEDRILAKIKGECEDRGEQFAPHNLICTKYRFYKYLTAEERYKVRCDHQVQRGKGILATRSDLLGHKVRRPKVKK